MTFPLRAEVNRTRRGVNGGAVAKIRDADTGIDSRPRDRYIIGTYTRVVLYEIVGRYTQVIPNTTICNYTYDGRRRHRRGRFQAIFNCFFFLKVECYDL